MPRIISARLRRLRLPLYTPYRLSYRTFEEFEPYVVTLRDDEGHIGFADGHISPGSSSETREGGWAFCSELLGDMIGQSTSDAKEIVKRRWQESKVAATALMTAIEVLEGHPLLDFPGETSFRLLAPTSAVTPEAITAEVEQRLADGYDCLKIKVGKDWEADLARVRSYQKAFAGRGTVRLDANRAFNRADAMRFAAALDPAGIELFEQPCAAEDWEANAAVAKVSTVPLMLDEPICAVEDIERAATIPGVGLCKLKLKRFGSLQGLADGLDLVRKLGMEPVLGDGLGCDIQGWLEAAVARGRITNAGEFNGFLKTKDRLMSPTLRFAKGVLSIPQGYRPALDMAMIEARTMQSVGFGRAPAEI